MAQQLRFQKILTDPLKIKQHYKAVKESPLGFISSLFLEEDLKYAVYTSLILASIGSFSIFLSLNPFKIFFFFLMNLVGIFIGALITVFVAFLAKSKIDYHQCINLNVHISLLIFPLTFVASHLPIINLASSLVFCYLSYLALVKRFAGNDMIVKVVYFCFMLIIAGSYFSW